MIDKHFRPPAGGLRPLMTRGVIAIAVVLLVAGWLLPAHAEWYAGGYGGISFSGSLSNVQLPLYGQSQAEAMFPQLNYAAGDTLTSSMSSSDLALKNSPIFGAKGGYFFKDEGLSWLGVEIEAFTTQPTIKQQTATTQLIATYSPKNPVPGTGTVPQTISQTGSLQIAESSMRVITLAFNVVARYPGKTVQPYIGVGVGGFYFKGSGQFDGTQWVPGLNASAGVKVFATEEWGFFVEGKYNLATIINLDPVYGLGGQYSPISIVGGIAYHF